MEDQSRVHLRHAPLESIRRGPGFEEATALAGAGFQRRQGQAPHSGRRPLHHREGALYIIQLGVPTQELRVQSPGKKAELLDRPIENIALLGSDEKLTWKHEDALTIAAPKSTPRRKRSFIKSRFGAKPLWS